MQIYLMRHAEAEDPHAWPGPDKTRPLTNAGVSGLEAALAHMKRHKLSVELLLTSPYERALQTADTIAENLHILQTVQCSELAAGARLDGFRALVARHAATSPLWIVGHMPEICVFTSHLTGDLADLERGFSPGEIVATDDGRVLWRRRLEDWAAA